ncbi:MAG: response regulator [Rhizobiaceae bacterium]|nr:response regulator [Rhizobiaceae bacterium]MCO5069905.1 response regulator [Rhizobiaceae bacterium]
MKSGPLIVLVVEDEPLVRMYAVDVAESVGLAVIEAPNADKAMEVLDARSDVSFLFTDIDMPGSMNGLQLAKIVAERWPQVNIVVTSGHVRIGAQELPPRSRFIAKPYDEHELEEALGLGE